MESGCSDLFYYLVEIRKFMVSTSVGIVNYFFSLTWVS